MAEKMSVAQLNKKYRDDGWCSAGLEKMCHGCGEERMVTSTTIHGKTEFYCNVCSTRWIPDASEVI